MTAAALAMGLSLETFVSLTPDEFAAARAEWVKAEERRERGSWERVRFMAACALQPYSRSGLKPRDIVVFPWEKSEDRTPEPMSREEMLEAFEREKQRLGLR